MPIRKSTVLGPKKCKGRPMLLKQNSELRKDGIWNWTIPAWHVRLSNGKLFKTCPNAGVCAQLCYALNGTYLFSNVKKAHLANLEFVLNKPQEWQKTMIAELQGKKFRPKMHRRDKVLVDRLLQENASDWLNVWLRSGGTAVRIHDAGDFFSADYLRLWFEIAKAIPDVLFYAYTKEVAMFKNFDLDIPQNFVYLFSTGGLQDHLIGDSRHADVFPNEEEISKAGYDSQDQSDLLAIFLANKNVGIPANNIKHFKKKMGDKRFSELVK